MKKSNLLIALATLSFSLAFSSTINAVQSQVNVAFTAGSQPVDPVDPDDPSKPLSPVVPGTGEAGPLTLNYVAPLAFGSYQVSATQQVYSSSSLKPYVQVTDLRGTAAGWTVTATASTFSTADPANTDSLPGAVITLSNGDILSANPGTPAPDPIDAVVLKADGVTSAVVQRAAAGTGMGTWVGRWYPDSPTDTENSNATLTVPGGAATVGANTATITWNLIDAPGV